ARTFKHRAELGNLAEQRRTERDAPSHRVALLLLAAVEFLRQQRLLEPMEDVLRKELANLDIAVAVECLAPFARHGRREPAAAPPRHAVSELQPGGMKPAAVESF